jgi:hypothetical protein
MVKSDSKKKKVPSSLKRYPCVALSDGLDSASARNPIEFDVLPVDVFHVIHSFLTHYNYRQFMNCAKSFFRSVRKETVYYDLIGMQHWMKKIKGRYGSMQKCRRESSIV